MKISKTPHLRVTLLLALVLGLAVFVVGCKSSPSPGEDGATREESAASEAGERAAGAPPAIDPQAMPAEAEDPALKIATFAAGCFWCIEPPFDETPGVKATIVGYTGGAEKLPTYEDVSYGRTGHTEAVRVYYNPDEVSYEALLTVFWRNINPTQKDGQFVDRGRQYRSGIYYHDAEQQRLAEASKAELSASGKFDKPIVTEVEPAGSFWKAEEYHQDFYKKSPRRYKSYRRGSGRDEYIQKTWGD